MHELAITQSVVDAVVEQTDGSRVTGVTLEIGTGSGVVADAVRFCFDLVVSGTTLDGAWLEIIEPPGRAHCRRCDMTFPFSGPLVVCACGGADVEVLSGQELRLRSVEVV